MRCTDCIKYYLGCDTEVFNYGYEENKAEECELFVKKKEDNYIKELLRKYGRS